jgi:hypothetical protein
MYKKRSSFVNGRPLYGWSAQSSQITDHNTKHDSHFNGGINEKVRNSKKNGLYYMTDEEREQLIKEYMERSDDE